MRVGAHSYLGNCRFMFIPRIRIGKYSSVGEGVVFMGSVRHPSSMNPKVVANFPFADTYWGDYERTGNKGSVIIKNDVWVGMEAMLMDGVEIGNGAIIGARTVVTKSVPDYAMVAGNPGRIIKYRFSHHLIQSLLKIAWWNWPDEQVKAALPDMMDVNKFVKKYL